MTSTTIGVSVLICTYNGSKTIVQTLEHLFAQRCSGFQWEILIVDNASTDSTFGCVYNFISASSSKIPDNLSISLLKEPIPGKTYALEKGFLSSKYSYVIICDDDNWLAKDYVQTAFDIMESDSSIGIMGGLGEPVCEINPPWWFENFKEQYATGPQNGANGEVERGWVFGAGMVVRKIGWIMLRENHYESILTCRKGEELSAGGDIEMCYSYSFLDLKIYYSNRLLFKHYLPKQRLEWTYVVRLYEGSAESIALLDFMRHFKFRTIKTESEMVFIYRQKLRKYARWAYNNWRKIIKLRFQGVPEGDTNSLEIRYNFIQLENLLVRKKTLMKQLRRINASVGRLQEFEEPSS